MNLRKVLKGLIITAFAFTVIFGLTLSPVSASSQTPIQSEFSLVLTYWSPYNSEYKLADPTIVDNTVDLMFLEGLRDVTKLDLGKSVWESTHPAITASNVYSLTMANYTYDTATSDGMTVNTEATCNAAETLISFKGTTNASAVAQYAQALSYFAYDGNDDGDYSDVADKGYLPHDENVKILVNNEMTCEGSDVQTYSTVDIVLETTTSTDYTISIKYWYTAGDSGWDFTTGNGATLEFFDCSGIPIVTVLDVAAILDADSESVNIIGSDYIKQYLYEDVASEYVQNELKNIAYYSSIPAFTDPTDNNNDFDMDGADEYFSGIDGTDYLLTVVTQDTTDTYDSSQELLLDQTGSITTIVPARYLYFTGTMAIYPSSWNFGSSTVSTGKYLTTETISFDTREIDTFDALANVLSVSTWQYNVTLEDTVMWDATNYENNLVTFIDNSLTKTETFRTAWTTTTDDSEVQYDIADPSLTDGDLDDLSLQYYTKISYSPTGSTTTTVSTTIDGGLPSNGGSADSTLGFVVIALVLLGLTVLYFKRK